MIHVVTAASRHLFEDELLELRRLALSGCIDGSGRFDSDDTVYLLAIEDGRVCGGSRLMPSIGPHILGDVFPHLASARGAPRDPAIYEWTPIGEPGQDLHAAGALMCALAEYCLAEGIDAVSGIIDARSLPRFHDIGWTVRPLGLPEQVGQDWMLAIVVPIDVAVLETTRAFHGIDEPMLIDRTPLPSVSVPREIAL